MEALTGNNLLIALIVIVAIAEAFNLATKTYQNLKAVKKPSTDLLEQVAKHQRMLDNDKKRLDAMDAGQNAICKALLAILNHEVTGNSTDKLKDAQKELTDYLIGR